MHARGGGGGVLRRVQARQPRGPHALRAAHGRERRRHGGQHVHVLVAVKMRGGLARRVQRHEARQLRGDLGGNVTRVHLARAQRRAEAVLAAQLAPGGRREQAGHGGGGAHGRPLGEVDVQPHGQAGRDGRGQRARRAGAVDEQRRARQEPGRVRRQDARIALGRVAQVVGGD